MRRFIVVSNFEYVALPQGLSLKDALLKYRADPHAEYAEPNYLRHATAANQNDPLFLQEWTLRNIGQFDYIGPFSYVPHVEDFSQEKP